MWGAFEGCKLRRIKGIFVDLSYREHHHHDVKSRRQCAGNAALVDLSTKQYQISSLSSPRVRNLHIEKSLQGITFTWIWPLCVVLVSTPPPPPLPLSLSLSLSLKQTTALLTPHSYTCGSIPCSTATGVIHTSLYANVLFSPPACELWWCIAFLLMIVTRLSIVSTNNILCFFFLYISFCCVYFVSTKQYFEFLIPVHLLLCVSRDQPQASLFHRKPYESHKNKKGQRRGKMKNKGTTVASVIKGGAGALDQTLVCLKTLTLIYLFVLQRTFFFFFYILCMKSTVPEDQNGVYSLKWRLTDRYLKWGTLAHPWPGRGRSVQIEWIFAWTAHLGFPALLSVPHLLAREIIME